jgi:hypothetical protein
VQIETQTAAFRVDDIQAAYNDAVLSGRTLLAREIEQLWIGTLANQRVSAEKRQRSYTRRCWFGCCDRRSSP